LDKGIKKSGARFGCMNPAPDTRPDWRSSVVRADKVFGGREAVHTPPGGRRKADRVTAHEQMAGDSRSSNIKQNRDIRSKTLINPFHRRNYPRQHINDEDNPIFG
jgi:hypothetical protein